MALAPTKIITLNFVRRIRMRSQFEFRLEFILNVRLSLRELTDNKLHLTIDKTEDNLLNDKG